ncbi:MAG: hypothetical protein MO853_02560 [Candidatus Protistobacter heckmanni]|nr:hypothetical protein [Candidatus Protistobacter heckmanni]
MIGFDREYERFPGQIELLLELLAGQSRQLREQQASIAALGMERDALAAERLRLQAKIQEAKVRVQAMLDRLPQEESRQLDLLAPVMPAMNPSLGVSGSATAGAPASPLCGDLA